MRSGLPAGTSKTTKYDVLSLLAGSKNSWLRSGLPAGPSKTTKYNVVNLQAGSKKSWMRSCLQAGTSKTIVDVQSLPAGTEWKYDEELSPSWHF